MADFQDYLAGAGSGALAGSAAGPFGAIAGGVLGLLGASQKKAPEEYHDPFEQQRLAAANNMEHSTTGQDAAANASTQIRQNAMESYEGIKDNPNFQGNAGVQSAAYSKAMTGAQRGIVGANIAGAQTDEATHERGADMLSGIQSSNYQTYLNNYKVDNAPNAMDTIAQTALGKLAGKGIEGLGGGDSGDTTTDSGGHSGDAWANKNIKPDMSGSLYGYHPPGISFGLGSQ